jgi:secreted trypsin-like serine protease
MGQGVCIGDQGAPLFFRYGSARFEVGIAGIVSLIPGTCEFDGNAVVYTRLSYYLPFIKQIVDAEGSALQVGLMIEKLRDDRRRPTGSNAPGFLPFYLG